MIKVSAEDLDIIRNSAEETYPEECCGLLLGRIEDEIKTVVEVWKTKNNWNQQADDFAGISGLEELESSQYDRFSIAPEVLLQAQKESRERGLAIVGVYHSHPNGIAVPSEFDRAIAWQEYSYIIVSVEQGKAKDIHSWTLDEQHQFRREAIISSDLTRHL